MVTHAPLGLSVASHTYNVEQQGSQINCNAYASMASPLQTIKQYTCMSHDLNCAPLEAVVVGKQHDTSSCQN